MRGKLDRMRKLIVQEFVTLDALAAGPNDNVDFVPASTRGNQSFGREQLAMFDSINTIVLGRVTYQMFAGYWPNVTGGEDARFADKLNRTPKIVFSRSLQKAPWGSSRKPESSNPMQLKIKKLKQQPGKDLILWGSISLAQSLLNKGLIDEYRMVVCPIVLGKGRPLFGDKVASLDLKLIEVEPMDLGTVALKYVER